MKIGYCRVSAQGQSADVQVAALKQAGCQKVFVDKTKTMGAKLPELMKCIKVLGAGDVFMVWKLDRLGRSLRDLLPLLNEIHAKGVIFQSITESIDTFTPTGRAMWRMIGILADLQRSQLSERTQAGRKAAMDKGVKMGRKRLLSPEQIKEARKLIEGGKHPRAVAKSYKTSLATLYRALNQ